MPRSCRSTTTSSTPSRSRSACATSNEPEARARRDLPRAKPGGRLVICEFSHPPRRLRARRLRRLPALRDAAARASSRARTTTAYELPRRVDQRVARPADPQPVDPRRRVQSTSRTATSPLGVVALHRARKPLDADACAHPRRRRATRESARHAPSPTAPGTRRRLGHVNPSHPVARRGSALAANLGLSERVFASAADRAIAKAIDDGLERVEAGLLREVQLRRLDRGRLDAATCSRPAASACGPCSPCSPRSSATASPTTSSRRPQAIEITHLASLYHDDVMDDADRAPRGAERADRVGQLGRDPHRRPAVRPGQPAHGAASASGPSACRPTPSSGSCSASCTRRSARTEGEDPIEHYIQVLADKTGSLIAAAAQSGVVFSDADPAFEKPIVEFGEKIGVAFQLIDDVIDLSPQLEETGKVPGTDLRAGVVTLPLLRLRRAREDGCGSRRPARAHRARRGDRADPSTHSTRSTRTRSRRASCRRRRRSTRSSPSCASTRPRALRSLRRTAGRARPSRRSRRCPRAP